MNKSKVFKMNECDLVASKQNKKETLDWYLKEYGLKENENPIEEVEELDLDKECVWTETIEEKDIKKAKRIHPTSRVKKGDVKPFGSLYAKFVPLRKVLEQSKEFTEPYIIASTEI